MKYIDNGVIYIPINKDTTQDEIQTLKTQHPDKTIVFLRSGQENMQKILLNFIVPR